MSEALKQNTGKFDVVHIHSVFLWPTTAGAKSAQRFQVPYVISPRGMLVADLIRRKNPILKSAWIAMFDKANIRSAAAIHATSETEVREMQSLGINSSRFAVIPNGLNLPRWAGDGFFSLGIVKDRRPRVLFLGRINWKKGIDLLIRAMAFVPEAHLVVAGNDEERYTRELIELVEKLGFSDRISFIGPVHGEAKWNLLRSADVFALTSYSENFGNSVLEAMACGVPVVVTTGVGLASTVAADATGRVVDGTPAAIGSAIQELLLDPHTRCRLGRNGSRIVAEKFSWSNIAREMIDLYSEVAMECAY